MTDIFGFAEGQGPTRNAKVTLGGTRFETNQRLVDDAVWVDRSKTGKPDTVPGWYRLVEGKWVLGPAAPELPSRFEVVDINGGKPGEGYQGPVTLKNTDNGAMFMHPRFFTGGLSGVQAPGWYKDGKPAEAKAGWARRALGAIKGTGSALLGDLKENIVGETQRAIKAGEQIAMARAQGEDVGVVGGALGHINDRSLAATVGAFEATAGNVGQGAAALYNKGMGALTDDAAQKRLGQQLSRDRVTLGHTKDAAARELALEQAVKAMDSLRLDLGMFGKQGLLLKDDQGRIVSDIPEVQQKLSAFEQQVAQVQQLSRQVEQDQGHLRDHADWMKGIGNLSQEGTDLAVQLLLMEATGGLGLAQKGKAAAMAAREVGKAGAMARLGQRLPGVLTKHRGSLLDTLAARGAEAAIAGKRAPISRLAQKIVSTSQDPTAGLLKRGLAHTGQSVAMGLPGAGQELAHGYASDENKGLLAATGEVLAHQPKAAMAMVPMLSERLRKVSMPLDRTSLKGALGNTALRTGMLTATGTGADLVASGFDPESVGSLPHHIKGLLGLELYGGLKGIGGSRRALGKAARSENEGRFMVEEAREAIEKSKGVLELQRAQLEELRKTAEANPEDLLAVETNVKALERDIAESEGWLKMGQERMQGAAEVSKDLGVKPEQLQTRANQLGAKALPKKAMGKAAEGMLGKPTPKPAEMAMDASRPMADRIAIARLLDPSVPEERKALRDLGAELASSGKADEARAFMMEKGSAFSADEVKAGRPMEQPAASGPETAPKAEEGSRSRAESFLSQKDILDPMRGTDRGALPEGEYQRIAFEHGMDISENRRDPQKVQAFRAAVESAKRKEGLRLALARVSEPKPKAEPKEAEAPETPAAPKAVAPKPKPRDYAAELNDVLDNPHLKKSGLEERLKELSGDLGKKHLRSRAAAAADALLDNQDSVKPGTPEAKMLEAALKSRDPHKSLKKALEGNDAALNRLLTDPLVDVDLAQDRAVLELSHKAAQLQRVSKEPMTFAQAFTQAYGDLVRIKAGWKVDPWQLKALPSLAEAQARAVDLVDGLRGSMSHLSEKGGEMLSDAQRHAERRRDALQRSQETLETAPNKPDARSLEGLQAMKAKIEEQIRRLQEGRKAVEQDPANLEPLGGVLEHEVGSWAEEVKLRHGAAAQGRMVFTPTGERAKGYTVKWSKDRKINLVHALGQDGKPTDKPLFRLKERNHLVNNLAAHLSEEQLRVLWEADHKADVPFGQTGENGQPAPGLTWNWKLVNGRLVPEPRAAVHTLERAGEGPEEMDVQVGHFDMTRFKAKVDAHLKAQGYEAPDWNRAWNGTPGMGRLPQEALEAGKRLTEREQARAQAELARRPKADEPPQVSDEAFHEEMVQARKAQRPAGDPEVAAELAKAVGARGAAALAIGEETLLSRLRQFGALETPLERAGKAKASGVTLTGPEMAALLDLYSPRTSEIVDPTMQGGAPNRRGRTGASSEAEGRVAPMDRHFSEVTEREEADLVQGRKDMESGADVWNRANEDRAAGARRAQARDAQRDSRATAAQALRKLYEAGVLKAEDFIANPPAHEYSPTEEGGMRVHRNAWMRRQILGEGDAGQGVLGELAEAVPSGSEMAELLHMRVEEHRLSTDRGGKQRTLPGIPEGYTDSRHFYTQGGVWAPNPHSVEARPIFDHRLAQRELPPEGDLARQQHIDAMKLDPSLRSSMQRVMLREQLLDMADAVRHGKEFEHLPEAERTKAAELLEGKADKAAHEGDLALFDHIEATSGSYYKPLLEPRRGDARPGAERTTLDREDMLALTNRNHERHQAVLEEFKGAGKWAGVEPDAIPAEPMDPLTVHLPERRAPKPQTPKEATELILREARTVVGDLNSRDRVVGTIKRWAESGEQHLQEQAARWKANVEAVRAATAGTPEAGRTIIDFLERMDPTISSHLKVEQGQEGVNADYNFVTNTLTLQEGFRKAVEAGWNGEATRVFFHETGHWLSSYFDSGFRARIIRTYEDQVSREVERNPILNALFGEGSPLEWARGNFSSLQGEDMLLTRAEAMQLARRLQNGQGRAGMEVAAELDYRTQMQGEEGMRNLLRALDPANKEHAELIRDGYTHYLDLKNFSKMTGEAKRFYRFTNADEHFAEAFGDFVMLASGLKGGTNRERMADLVDGSGLQANADMLTVLKVVNALRSTPGGGKGGNNLANIATALNIAKNVRAAGSTGARGGGITADPKREKPITVMESPSLGTNGEAWDRLERVRAGARQVAEKTGELVRPAARLATSVVAADAVSPKAREYAGALQYFDSLATNSRALDEVSADRARLAVDGAFRRDNSKLIFDSVSTLVATGKAKLVGGGPDANRSGIKLYKVEVGGETYYANQLGSRTLQVTSARQLDAIRFVESNGQRGGNLLTPELRKELLDWMPMKQEMEDLRRREMVEAGVDAAEVEKMWVRDYLPHLYAAPKASRKVDPLTDAYDVTLASLDRIQRREYDSYDQALTKGGLLPQYNNPLEAYVRGAREFRKVVELRRAVTLAMERGDAYLGYREERPGYVRLELGPKGSNAMKRLGFHQEDPLEVGEAPGRKGAEKDIWIHPELNRLYRSMFDTGLSAHPIAGPVYRAAAKVNHLLTPVKLSMDIFHMGMIGKLGAVEAVRSSTSVYRALREQGVPHAEAIQRAYQGVASQAFAVGAHEAGREWRQKVIEHGHKSLEEIKALPWTDAEKATLVLYQLGNYNPGTGSGLHSREREALRQTLFELKDSPLFGSIRAAGRGYRAAMEQLEDLIMDKTVSPLKAGSMALEFQKRLKARYGAENGWFDRFADDAFNARAELNGKETPYRTTEWGEFARQAVAHTDNVFGMSNYRKLMIHPVLKDVMHLWNLAFGWRLGGVRTLGKALDQGANSLPVAGDAWRGLKRGMGGTGIQDPVAGRGQGAHIAAHAGVDATLTLLLAAVGMAQLPNWTSEDQKDNFSAEGLRMKLEDLLFPVLTSRLNHTNRQNRWTLGGRMSDYYGFFKNPKRWIWSKVRGNSPLVDVIGKVATGEDAIGNEIGNPFQIMPEEQARKVQAWLDAPDGDPFTRYLAKLALQAPQEFLPISAQDAVKLTRQGEDPAVASLSLAGIRKVSDYQGMGASNAELKAIEMSQDSIKTAKSKDGTKQELKETKDKAVSEALNAKDPSILNRLAEEGMSPGQVTRLRKEVFNGDQPRSAVERMFKRAKFEDKLTILLFSNKAEAKKLWPLFQEAQAGGLRYLDETDPARAAAARARVEEIRQKWGL